MKQLGEGGGKIMPSGFQVLFSKLDKHSASNNWCLKRKETKKNKYPHSVGNLQARQVNAALIILCVGVCVWCVCVGGCVVCLSTYKIIVQFC